MSDVPVLVLIVNYRTAALALDAVQSILPEVRARGDTQVIVVDNGSSDGSWEILKAGLTAMAADSMCELLTLPENLGFAAGNNAGLDRYRECFGSWPTLTWLLNPDTLADSEALTALADFMDSHPSAGLVGGQCLREDGSVRPSAFRFHTPLNEFLATLDFGPLRRLLRRHDVLLTTGTSPMRADWLSGAHLMIRGEVFAAIGGFDPGYFLYFEETDFCARAADAGFESWYDPASRIIHLGGRATGVSEFRSSDRRPRYWFASRARFMLRRYGRLRTHLANLVWLIATPVGIALALLRGRRRQDPPRLWRDFLWHQYGPGGLMYRHAHRGREEL